MTKNFTNGAVINIRKFHSNFKIIMMIASKLEKKSTFSTPISLESYLDSCNT